MKSERFSSYQQQALNDRLIKTGLDFRRRKWLIRRWQQMPRQAASLADRIVHRHDAEPQRIKQRADFALQASQSPVHAIDPLISHFAKMGFKSCLRKCVMIFKWDWCRRENKRFHEIRIFCGCTDFGNENS